MPPDLNPTTDPGTTGQTGSPTPSTLPTSASPDGQGAGSSQAPSGSPAVPVSTVVTGAPDPNPPATGLPGAPAAPAQPSWLQQLRDSGVDLGTQDETQARQQLTQMYRDWNQLRPLSPYVSAYLQHSKEFAQWLQQRDNSKPAGAPSPGTANPNDPYWKDYFNPPEYNPLWEKQIVKDANGNLMPAPGAPADVVARYQAYAQFRQDQAERFMQNPHAYIEPTVKHLARQIAEQIVNERLSKKDATSAAREFVHQNANWLYELDPQGQPKMAQVFNPMNGQYDQSPVLSVWGQAFQRYARERQSYQQQRGFFDEADMKSYALAMVQRDYAVAKLNNQSPTPAAPNQPVAPPPSPQTQANDTFLKRNNPPAAQPGTNGNSRSIPAEVTRMNLEQRMLEGLKSAGFSD